MLTHICGRCGFKSCKFVEWSNHLLEFPHQTDTRTSFLRWSRDDDEKSLVVYAHREDSPMDILDKFRELASDFVFWTNVPGLFIVQVVTREDAEILMKNLRLNPDEMKIGGRDIQLRRKSDVSQNEWIILVGDGTTKEGSSREPVCIELSDDNDSNDGHYVEGMEEEEIPEVVPKNKTKIKQERHSKTLNGSTKSTKLTDETASNCSPLPDDDAIIEDVTIKTKMSEDFSKTFLSKFKAEKAEDNKRNVTHNLLAMSKEWMKMYVDFQNVVWTVCFLMGNSQVLQDVTSDSFKCKFACECLASEKNEWLKVREKLSAGELEEFVDNKVIEFFRIFKSETKLVQRFKALSQCSRIDKPLLKFDCSFNVKFNEKGAKASLKISNMTGKNVKRKMKLVTKIFTGLFTKYESLIIKGLTKSNGSEVTNRTIKNEHWKRICSE